MHTRCSSTSYCTYDMGAKAIRCEWDMQHSLNISSAGTAPQAHTVCLVKIDDACYVRHKMHRCQDALPYRSSASKKRHSSLSDQGFPASRAAPWSFRLLLPVAVTSTVPITGALFPGASPFLLAGRGIPCCALSMDLSALTTAFWVPVAIWKCKLRPSLLYESLTHHGPHVRSRSPRFMVFFLRFDRP